MQSPATVQAVKNSNKQRGEPLPSELAQLHDLELADIKPQGAKMKDAAERNIGNALRKSRAQTMA